MNSELPYLTSLRGLCALSVLISHCFAIPVAGNTVEVFFVLSGYVLAWGQMRQPRGAWAFWVARLARTAPVHLVATGVVGAIALATHRDTLGRLLANLALLPVLAQNRVPLNGPTWSLAVEWLCYLAFPVAIIGIRRAPLLVLSLCVVFLVGQTFWVAFWGGWLPIILHGAADFGIGAALAALGLQPRPLRWLAWLDCKPALWLGEISYPLYLIQLAPLIVLCDGGESWRVPPSQQIAAGLCAIVLAILLHLTVERPTRRFFKRRRRALPAARIDTPLTPAA